MSCMKGNRNARIEGIGNPILVVLLTTILLYVASVGCSGQLTPEEVAQIWVNDNIDLGGELLAEWILGAGPVEPSSAAGWLAKEMGADLIEDLIHEVIKWDHSSAQRVSGGWEVTATASISFPDYAGFEAGLPLVLRIEGEEISEWRVDYMSAYARADLPDIGSMVGAVSSISGVLGAEDCLEAAKAAGVPNPVIKHLSKPAPERNFMEKAAIEAAVSDVDLPDGCVNALVGE